MKYDEIEARISGGISLSAEEALWLYNECPPAKLFELANRSRFLHNPEKRVSWQIDRNINYSNVCISGCLFCNFHCRVSEKEKAWETSMDEYKIKIDELFALGGDQVLLQGGLHPNFDIAYYENLFKSLKAINPLLKLNALGPPEVWHIARISKLSIRETLQRLRDAGLDSLPGAGAEILNDRVRKLISPAKPGADAWISVMKEAHSMGFGSTATMVYGHIETVEERVEHLIKLRDLQSQKPDNMPGFRAFICWPMQVKGTRLAEIYKIEPLTPVENLKMVAISRLVLDNIRHIQVSWLTIGRELAKVALHCGADDMGSIMIEENVVSSAGASYRSGEEEIKQAIREAGFDPWLRNQDYTPYLRRDLE